MDEIACGTAAAAVSSASTIKKPTSLFLRSSSPRVLELRGLCKWGGLGGSSRAAEHGSSAHKPVVHHLSHSIYVVHEWESEPNSRTTYCRGITRTSPSSPIMSVRCRQLAPVFSLVFVEPCWPVATGIEGSPRCVAMATRLSRARLRLLEAKAVEHRFFVT